MLEHTKCRARSDLSLPCFSGYLTLHSGPRWRLETTRLALSEVSPGSKVPRVARSAPIDVGSVGRPPRTWFEIASGYGYLASLTLNAHSCLLSIHIIMDARVLCCCVEARCLVISGLAAGVLEHTKCRARSDLSLPCFSGYLTLHSGPRWRLETTRLALSEVSPGSKVPRVARSAPIDVGSVGRPPRTWFEIASGYGYLASLTLNAHSCLLSIHHPYGCASVVLLC